MSIETNKLVNLGDAKVLYDDLRDRSEHLKSALDDIYSGAKIEIDSLGTKYMPYTITSGKVYTIVNNTTKACTVRTGNTTSGDTVQNVSDNFVSGASLEFTASGNANYVRLYFPEAGTGTVKINDNASMIFNMDKDIEALENKMDIVFVGNKITVNRSGIFYQALDIQSGHRYIIVNNTDKACTIRTGNATSGDTVQSISDNFDAGDTLGFVATANAKYIRYNFPNAASGNMLAYDNASVAGKTNLFFANKTLVTIGDSIFGQYADGGLGVSDFLANITGMNVINVAFGGTRMVKRSATITDAFCAFDFENLVDAIVDDDYSAQETSIETHSSSYSSYFSARLQTLENIDWDHVGAITINYGTNDWAAGTSADKYRDAYISSLTKFIAKYPHIRVYIISTAYRFWQNTDHEITEDSNTQKYGNPAVNLPEFNSNIYDVGESLSLPVVDIYNIGMNRETAWNYFTIYDTTHPALEGRKLIGESIGRQILGSITGIQKAKYTKEFLSVEHEASLVKNEYKNTASKWTSGYYYVSGNPAPSSKAIRTDFLDDINYISTDKDHYLSIYAFDSTDNTCKGILMRAENTHEYTWSDRVTKDIYEFNIDGFKAIYPTYRYKAVLYRQDNSDIDTTECQYVTFHDYVNRYWQPRRRPLLTFIDDDGRAEAGENWEDIISEVNIPVTFALITSLIGTDPALSWDEVERLQNKGCEFISHTHNHLNLGDDTIPEETVIEDFEDTISALKAHGCASQFVAYPYAFITNANKALVKDYFKLGIHLFNYYNYKFVERTLVRRIQLVKGNIEQKTIDGQQLYVYSMKTLDEMKAIIDKTIMDNAWTIICTHLRNSATNTPESDGFYCNDDVKELIENTVTYARAKGVEVVTVADAYKEYRDVFI